MEKRKYIVIHQGADNVKLGNDLETLDLLLDTKDSLEPCAKEICDEIDDYLMNNDDDVTITGFKHGGSTPPVGPETTAFSNQTTALPWEKILEFTVTEEEDREKELSVLKEKLKTGEITHVYAKVGEATPVVFAIFQLGA
jgi:hypothetical protein